MNSPGGSPSQSSLIAARIIRLSKKKDIPVLAFCEDVAASGGYWLACSANEIYADENSIVGSIGVISAGFGFHEFITRQGVERRVYTSGEEKSMLDPFKPEKKDEILRLKAIQKGIHENFKNFVTKRRTDKISGKKIGQPISYIFLCKQYENLKKQSDVELIINHQMNPDRADVIVQAVNVYLLAMKLSGSNKIYVPKIGLADGTIKLLYLRNKKKGNS